VQRSEKQNEEVVFCEALGILSPRISWFVNQEEVRKESVTKGEWSFVSINSTAEVASVDKWYSVATGKLTFNATSNVSLQCAHQLATPGTLMYSEPYTCKLYYMCYQVK